MANLLAGGGHGERWGPAGGGASGTATSVAPASAVSVALSASTLRMRLIRASEITTASPPGCGVAAPNCPVLPPCATMATGAPAHAFTTSATPVGFGRRTTDCALPWERPRQ